MTCLLYRRFTLGYAEMKSFASALSDRFLRADVGRAAYFEPNRLIALARGKKTTREKFSSCVTRASVATLLQVVKSQLRQQALSPFPNRKRPLFSPRYCHMVNGSPALDLLWSRRNYHVPLRITHSLGGFVHHIHVRIHRWVVWWFYVGAVCGVTALVNILGRDLTRTQELIILIFGVLHWLLGGLVCWVLGVFKSVCPSRWMNTILRHRPAMRRNGILHPSLFCQEATRHFCRRNTKSSVCRIQIAQGMLALPWH